MSEQTKIDKLREALAALEARLSKEEGFNVEWDRARAADMARVVEIREEQHQRNKAVQDAHEERERERLALVREDHASVIAHRKTMEELNRAQLEALVALLEKR
jgi:hypothetical protein